MKLVSTALLAAGLAALGACSGGGQTNTTVNTVDETYNVASDDLGAGNLSDNGALGNIVTDNAAGSAAGNGVAVNSTSITTTNSH